MLVGTIIGIDYSRSATLCRNRMTPHWIDLGDYRDAQIRVRFCHRDCGTQAGPATTYDDDIM
jgi:hypothetical protein